jgi:hypothetical protein
MYITYQKICLSQGCAFWGHIRKNFYLGAMPPISPHFLAEIGISSLNVESNNFRTGGPISVIHGSNDAAPRMEYGPKGLNKKFDVSGS